VNVHGRPTRVQPQEREETGLGCHVFAMRKMVARTSSVSLRAGEETRRRLPRTVATGSGSANGGSIESASSACWMKARMRVRSTSGTGELLDSRDRKVDV
jgi:hypothetical protein